MTEENKTEGPDLTAEETQALEAEKSGAPAPEAEDVEEDTSEAESASEKTDEPPADDGGAKEKEAGKPKFVPLAALDSERDKKRALEDQVADLQQVIRSLQAPSQAATQQEQPAQVEMPDPVLEPEKYRAWWENEKRQITAPYEEHQRQAYQQQQVFQQFGQLKGYAATHEEAFRKEMPDADYDGALDFMRGREQRKFEVMGYHPQEIPQLVAQSELAITLQAAGRRQNPAALIYNLALENGFNPKGAAADKSPSSGSDDGDKVTRLAEIQKQTASASNAGGAARRDPYTLADLASMKPADLAKFEKENPEAFRKAVGG